MSYHASGDAQPVERLFRHQRLGCGGGIPSAAGELFLAWLMHAFELEEIMDKNIVNARNHRSARHVRKDDADAFIRHPDDQAMRSDDALAESFGEEFIRSATTGEDLDDTLYLDEEVTEEIGGPFVVSTAEEEFAMDDNGLPPDAEVAERPQAVDSLAQPPGSDVAAAPRR